MIGKDNVSLTYSKLAGGYSFTYMTGIGVWGCLLLAAVVSFLPCRAAEPFLRLECRQRPAGHSSGTAGNDSSLGGQATQLHRGGSHLRTCLCLLICQCRVIYIASWSVYPRQCYTGVSLARVWSQLRAMPSIGLATATWCVQSATCVQPVGCRAMQAHHVRQHHSPL